MLNVLALAVFVALGPSQPTSPPAPPATVITPAPSLAPAVESLKERLDRFVATSGVPGATLAVVWPDGRSCRVASGLADRETSAPMPADARMMSGSIGKSFVAATALLLAEQNRLDLDAPLSTILGEEPWFARLPNAADLTLRSLLNHTSGIPEHVTRRDFVEAIHAAPEKSWTASELLAFTLDRPALFPVGKGWSYADTNYIVAGAAIEKVTSRPYNDLVVELWLKPVHLRETSPVTSAHLPGIVPGHTGEADPFFGNARQVGLDGRYPINPQFEWTGGGLLTSSHDLAHWMCALYTDDLLKSASRTQMLDAQPARTGPGDRYGLGTQVLRTPHGDAWGHSGFFPGYVSLAFYFPELGLAAAAQFNTSEFARLGGMRQLLFDAASLAHDAV